MKKVSIVSLILVMVMGMFMMPITSLAAENTDDFEVSYIKKIDDIGDSGVFSQELGDGNFCVIKHGSNHVIVWSEDALSAEEQAAIETVVKANDSSVKAAQFQFTTGKEIDGAAETGQGNWGTYTITQDTNGHYTLTCDADKISHLDYGKYTRPVEEVDQWVQVSTTDDSCTGFGSDDGIINSNVGSSWFLKQTLNADAAEYPMYLDIIAGNPKNGANVVGTLTVDKADDVYQLSYKFNEQAQPANPEIGDTYTTVEIHDAHYNYTGSGTAINKAPGQNLDLTNGVTFTPQVDGNQYELFAHFSITVTTYEYQLVPVVAE